MRSKKYSGIWRGLHAASKRRNGTFSHVIAYMRSECRQLAPTGTSGTRVVAFSLQRTAFQIGSYAPDAVEERPSPNRRRVTSTAA
jgi:hypothetical protein